MRGVCTDSPSGLRLVGPPLPRGGSLGYRSSPLGTVLGFACSLGTAHNPLTGQYGVWAEDRERSVQSWSLTSGTFRTIPPGAPEAPTGTALQFSTSLGQFCCSQSPGFDSEHCMRIFTWEPTSQGTQGKMVKKVSSQFLPH